MKYLAPSIHGNQRFAPPSPPSIRLHTTICEYVDVGKDNLTMSQLLFFVMLIKLDPTRHLMRLTLKIQTLK